MKTLPNQALEGLKRLSSKLRTPLYKLTSLFSIAALLVPFILIGTPQRVYAQSRGLNPLQPLTNLSNSISSFSESLNRINPLPQTDSIKSPVSLNSITDTISNTSSSVIDFVSIPTLPEGFENAKPVSPMNSALSSFGTTIFSSTLDFFVDTSANPDKSATENENTIELDKDSDSEFIKENEYKSSNTTTMPSDSAFPSGSVPFDFVGDSKADFVRYQSSNNDWEIIDGDNGTVYNVTHGTGTTLVPGDYDGDSKTDFATYSNGTWSIRKSSDTNTITHSFGVSTDIVTTGDYDGDGYSDYSVYRPSTNVWYVKSIQTGIVTQTTVGATGDIPVQGDYNNDGTTDMAFYRPSTGDWHIYPSGGTYYSFHWGIAEDTPVPADFDGDGATDISVFRPSTGTWYIYKSSTNDGSYIQQVWGNYGDQPVPADYDGDGNADMAVWRPATGVWFVDNSSNGNYTYEQLGANGDVPAQAAYLKKVSGVIPDYRFSQIRLEPINATGGTNLYSRNFGWGTGLVGLPGRAGLNAGFGISYNSLIWIKDEDNDSIHFNPDLSNVTPGFQMGFPEIETAYHDKATGKFSYLMRTPSGGRVEFKQTAATDTYESIDSSFAQLKLDTPNGPNDPADDIGITLTTTDGTQTTFEYSAGSYRVSKIKDRNGNYITVNHDEYGLLRTVTDTLGRVITVNYDSEQYPTTITQQWKDSNGDGNAITHTYATFSYDTEQINTNFDTTNLTIYGPPNGTNIKVLDKITFADGSSTRFDYNGYGQVEKVNNYAADGTTKLNSVATNLDNVTGIQTDVPRLTQQRSYVKDFNNDNEVVVNNTLSASTTTPSIPGESSEPARLIQIKMVNNPYDAATNIYVGDSGWNEGLPILTEDYIDVVGSSFTRKRWSFTKWEQDDETLTYSVNPRTIRTKVGDDENSSVIRTEIDYWTTGVLAEFDLTKETRLYDNTTNTLHKKQITHYQTDSVYISKRIIGLPSEVNTYGDENGTLVHTSQATFTYDGNNYTTETNQNISPTQHDTTNYGTSYNLGRGNVTKVKRHNVDNGSFTSSEVYYDVAGSPVASINPLGVKTTTDYTDRFNDDLGNTLNRDTYAYPTKLTTPSANNSGDISSYIDYRYDIGANVKALSPAITGQNDGKETTREFDSVGRLQKQTLVNNGAYTRYEYPTNQTETASFATIIAGEGEVESRTFTDGAGRTLRSRTELPNSTGGWNGTKAEYDILGRVTRTTVPTEVDSSFDPAGDDVRSNLPNNEDFLWTEQVYDWNNRVIEKIDTEGNNSLISYNGCGCAGGMEITVKGEEIIETDWDGSNPNNLGRRTQKVYQDILGRTYKTQVMNWDGVTPYTTTVQTFNGHDQVLTTTKYEGTETSSTSQQSTATYDGFGRMKTNYNPSQDTGKQTTYNYNSDDSISSIVDARGVTKSYTYNNLGLVTQVSHSVPTGSSIPTSPTVNFSYNNLGNRTQMTDGLGTIDYEYNELSQLKSETRSFADTLADAPLSGNGFKLEYTYTLSGQLKSYKDPYGEQVNMDFDAVGRLLSVTGTSFAGVTTYAENAEYRAWGELKKLDFGNGMKQETTYNKLLRPDNFKLKEPDNSLKMDKNYEYYADGSLKKLNDTVDSVYDRLNKFDHIGRIKEGKAGVFARDESHVPGENDAPYTKTYDYGIFGKLKGDVGGYWGFTNNSYNYDFDTQGRVTNQSYNGTQIDSSKTWTYDADGRPLRSYDEFFKKGEQEYDAAGNLVKLENFGNSGPAQNEKTLYQDGNGALGKKEFRYTSDGSTWENDSTGYYITSAVLGGKVITEVDDSGNKLETSIIASNREIAQQKIIYDENGIVEDEEVVWKNPDSFGMSDLQTRKKGQETDVTGIDHAPFELDTMGLDVRSRMPSSGGGGTLDPEIPILQNDGGVEGSGNDDYSEAYGAGGGIIGPLCDVGGPVAVECNRIQFVDGFGRSGVFSGLERNNYYANRPVAHDVTVREIVIENPPAGRPPEGTLFAADGESYLIGYLITIRPVFSNWGINSYQTGTKASLKPDDQKEYNENKVEVLEKLADISDKCKELLAKTGKSIEEIVEAINLQRPFDATESTISRSNASLIDEFSWVEGAIEEVKNRNRNQTVKNYFKVNKTIGATTAIFPGGLLALTVSERSDVYFRPSKIKAQNILHEAIHSATGFSDQKLYELFTGKDASTSDNPSNSIRLLIKEKCF